jgi:hypothetical protein
LPTHCSSANAIVQAGERVDCLLFDVGGSFLPRHLQRFAHRLSSRKWSRTSQQVGRTNRAPATRIGLDWRLIEAPSRQVSLRTLLPKAQSWDHVSEIFATWQPPALLVAGASPSVQINKIPMLAPRICPLVAVNDFNTQKMLGRIAAAHAQRARRLSTPRNAATIDARYCGSMDRTAHGG